MSEAIGIGCCWLVATVFVISAAGKLRNSRVRAAFRRSIRDMELLPASAAAPLAVAVPIGELVAAALLVMPSTTVIGAAFALALLAVFTTGIALVLRRGTAASCLCFGTTPRLYGPRHLVRNALLGGAVFVGAMLPDGPADQMAAGVAIAVGVVGASVVVMFEEMLVLLDKQVSRR